MNNTTLTQTTREIILHHLSSFQDNDLDAVVSDYTSQSMLITHDNTYTGPEEIKTFFAGLMVHFPKQGSTFELDKLVVDGGVAFIVWHARTPSLDVSLGTDTFLLQDGKIHRQTFAGKMQFM